MKDETQQQRNEKTMMTTTTTVIPSGFPEYRTRMIFGFIFLTILYIGIIAIFDHIVPNWIPLPPSGQEYCDHRDEDSPCYRGDLFAFEVVSGLALMWCGYIGFYVWHIEKSHLMVENTPEGRLFGYIDKGKQLCAISTTFQLFDLAVSLNIPEQRQFLFLCHHIMAATVSWYGLNNQYFHYYGVFFLGCSEISTIPLVFIDIAKYFPPVSGTKYDILNSLVCGPLFAIAFTYYRVILWWRVSYQMFHDISYVLRNGVSNKLRPGRDHVLYVMMTLNLLLGVLQLYWFSTILEEAAKFLGVNQEAFILASTSTTNAIKEDTL